MQNNEFTNKFPLSASFKAEIAIESLWRWRRVVECCAMLLARGVELEELRAGREGKESTDDDDD